MLQDRPSGAHPTITLLFVRHYLRFLNELEEGVTGVVSLGSAKCRRSSLVPKQLATGLFSMFFRNKFLSKYNFETAYVNVMGFERQKQLLSEIHFSDVHTIQHTAPCDSTATPSNQRRNDDGQRREHPHGIYPSEAENPVCQYSVLFACMSCIQSTFPDRQSKGSLKRQSGDPALILCRSVPVY